MKNSKPDGNKEFKMDRSRFLKLSTLMTAFPFVGIGSIFGLTKTKGENQKKQTAMNTSKPFAELLQYPFLNALFGRRARRFGLGMEIPTGPLAYRSDKEPVPLSEEEQMLLVASATGVSGWNFGVPFAPPVPNAHAEFTLRYTGRTAPTAAGIGTPALFFTDDKGCYCTNTRDTTPSGMQTLTNGEEALQQIVNECRGQTTQIKPGRLDLPSAPPHILPPNLWWANKPGSTLFIPVADTAEECLGIIALMVRHGAIIVDEETGKPAGFLEPFVRSGLLDSEKRFPLSELLTIVSEGACLATGFKGHNMVLMLQAMGLGGLYFSGLDDMSIMGARVKEGVSGLGFEFVEDELWVTPNPVGLKGVYEALCPPFYPDMHVAVKVFVERKFGKNGAYKPNSMGPWRDSQKVKETVEPYSQDFVDCMSEVAQYIYQKFGKFPGLRSTIMMPGFVQAHHLDTDFYDKYYKEGAYLQSHAEHMEKWHGIN
ncbi:hypothetical protein [Aquiflexum sp.]|uniref:hypothetical protein n=1 Tax=Aquiflexum sp. TaxID=1872584 RepID=UPI00359365CC